MSDASRREQVTFDAVRFILDQTRLAVRGYTYSSTRTYHSDSGPTSLSSLLLNAACFEEKQQKTIF